MRFSYVAIFVLLLIVSLPIVEAESMSLSYDANGNLVSDGITYRIYNGFNQLIEVRNGTNSSSPLLEEYRYHPIEERIAVKHVYNSTGSIIERVYYHDLNFVTVINSSGTFEFTYIYQNGILVAQHGPAGVEFLHQDIEGTPQSVTNEFGTLIENSTQGPFGEPLTGGNTTRFEVEGKEYDSVVGDYDFSFRKYDADLKIFTQPDVALPSFYEPKDLNRFAFEHSNPSKYGDPNGHNAIFVDNFVQSQHNFFAGRDAHEALIIGNSRQGYTVFSYSKGGFRPEPQHFKEFQTAMNYMNVEVEEGEPEFQVRAVFLTDEYEDFKLRQKALRNGEKEYSDDAYACIDFNADTMGLGKLGFIERNSAKKHFSKIGEAADKWNSDRDDRGYIETEPGVFRRTGSVIVTSPKETERTKPGGPVKKRPSTQ